MMEMRGGSDLAELMVISLMKGLDPNQTDVVVTLTQYSGSGDAR